MILNKLTKREGVSLGTTTGILVFIIFVASVTNPTLVPAAPTASVEEPQVETFDIAIIAQQQNNRRKTSQPRVSLSPPVNAPVVVATSPVASTQIPKPDKPKEAPTQPVKDDTEVAPQQTQRTAVQEDTQHHKDNRLSKQERKEIRKQRRAERRQQRKLRKEERREQRWHKKQQRMSNHRHDD